MVNTVQLPPPVATSSKRPWWRWLLWGCGSLGLLGAVLVGGLVLWVMSLLTPPDEPSCPAVIASEGDLKRARKGFVTKLAFAPDLDPPPPPPAPYRLVNYRSGTLALHAYITTGEAPGRHPAMLWLIGGFSNSVGDTPWGPSSVDNDQSARSFSNAGMVMMYPALRGGGGNPGKREQFMGEVDDVIAAAEYLASQPHVDPKRVYLGGHSTGGTLALLVAQARAGLFRAVFAFGPVADSSLYGRMETDDPCEQELRSPMWFMSTIVTPTYVIEGEGGNVSSFDSLRKRVGQAPVKFFTVASADHFSVLYPATRLVARKLVADGGSSSGFGLTSRELNAAFAATALER